MDLAWFEAWSGVGNVFMHVSHGGKVNRERSIFGPGAPPFGVDDARADAHPCVKRPRGFFWARDSPPASWHGASKKWKFRILKFLADNAFSTDRATKFSPKMANLQVGYLRT